MAIIDIFNGDADGICALTQLRNAQPLDSTLLTGVKRDIELVAQASVQAGDQLTVLDISYDKNRAAVNVALEKGASVFYCDHHFAGEIAAHQRLSTLIDDDPNICTSLLIDQYLNGQFREWAVAGAFGDNLKASARERAKSLDLSEQQLAQLDNIGTYINYNGYGSDLADLHFAPADLARLVMPYATPFAFMQAERDSFAKLESGYHDDMAAAQAMRPYRSDEHSCVIILPDEKWARRVSGVYSNDLTNESPARAHAVLTERPDQTYLVSVRAPLNNKTGADEICRQFPTGGGRKAAAGINALPQSELDAFIDVFSRFYR